MCCVGISGPGREAVTQMKLFMNQSLRKLVETLLLSTMQFVDAILFVRSPALPSRVAATHRRGRAQAEFDIDKGSVLRLQYPRKVTEDDGLMAELMIPEGIHNHFQDWTVFMLNRPSQTPTQASATTRWAVQAYRYEGISPEGNWVLASGDGSDAPHWALIDSPASQASASSRKEVHVVVQLDRGKTMRLQSHDELGLQYAALQPDFASMWTVDGEAVGLHFKSGAQQEEFKRALDAAVASQRASPGVLWCLSHVSSRRDSTVRRGAQVKALAVCSRFQFVHVWKPLLLLAVDRLYATSTGCASLVLRCASRVRRLARSQIRVTIGHSLCGHVPTANVLPLPLERGVTPPPLPSPPPPFTPILG